MSEPACLYALIESPRERHEAILARGVEPLATRWRDDPNLDSLFFVRYSEPVWQVRFRVLGEPGWIDRVARPACEAAFAPLLAEGVAGTLKFAVYDRELERYGGERGMRLAERLFHLDSLAVLDWLALERAGSTRWSRREFALAMAESFADGFGFDPTGRREFYRQGYQWAFDLGTWGESERALLEERFERNRPGLEALLTADPPRTGSPAEHALVAGFENDSVPTFAALRTGLADGSVHAHAPHLAWSLAHMFTNRLGIEPAAEAILRFMAGRRFDLALAAGESEPAAGALARE
jgi:thiopeptide-type bacteriocin biosynthesis protein